MISDLDISRSANPLEKQHGDDSPIEAAMKHATPAPVALATLNGSDLPRRTIGEN